MNKLIDPIKKYTESIPQYTAMDYAKSFVDGLTAEQKRRFRKMMSQGINVGESVSKTYGIDTAEFNKALKEVLI